VPYFFHSDEVREAWHYNDNDGGNGDDAHYPKFCGHGGHGDWWLVVGGW